MSRESDRPIGLRERKKARTRAAIQRHALRLFLDHGYAETTVEAIAEAAEVSPSTFFRYFPTKEDVMLYDSLDPIMFEIFQSQPAELTPLQAFRATMLEITQGRSQEQVEQERMRMTVARSAPELRARMVERSGTTVREVAVQIAERVGTDPDDFQARLLAGLLSGVSMAAMTAAEDDPTRDMFELVDQGLAQLESGIPFEDGEAP